MPSFRRVIPSFLAVTLLAISGISQSKVSAPKKEEKPPSTTDYSNEPLVVERRNFVEKYASDGTASFSALVRMRLQTDAAVREGGLLEFPYAARQDTIEIEYVRVQKPDGRVIETPLDDAQDLPMEVTRDAPFYSDLRVKQIPVKALSVGDVVEYRIHRLVVHPAAPGEFWGQEDFQDGGVVLDDTLELRFPKAKYVKVVSKDVQPAIVEEGGEKVYRWKTSHLEPSVAKTESKKEKKESDQHSVEFTTFHDWAAVGAWYNGLQKDRVIVTPDISAKAAGLTRGAKTDEDKIRALYEYVATQFRYIGVDFGVGRYQPHRASEVLDNQYGDCKDKHTLLASLLKAEGFSAWPALVNPVSKVSMAAPSPGQFSHVITVVQSGGKLLWMDSTTEVGPFQWLPPHLRGEQALLVPSSGEAHFAAMPDAPPYPAKTSWESVGKLGKDGAYAGHFEISTRDDFEVVLRAVYRSTARQDWDATTGKLMQAFGFAGSVSHATPSSPEDLKKPFHLAFDYEQKDSGDWANHRTVPMLPLWLFEGSKDDPKPQETFFIGSPGVFEFKSVTGLPEGFHPELPEGSALKNDFVEYTNTYSFSGGQLITERKFALKKGEIEPTAWEEYLRWEKTVTDNESSMVQLLAPGENAPSITASNPAAEALVRSAYEAIQSNERQKAWHDLDEARKLNPKQYWMWSEYGYLDAMDGNFDQAMVAFQKEIENFPEDATRHLELVNVLRRMKHLDDALELSRAVAKSAPNNVEAQTMLANLLLAYGKTDEAAALLEKLAAAPDASEKIKLDLARAYLKQQRKDDAEGLLKRLLSESKDPNVLNTGAYQLADANLALDVARGAAHQSLDLQDAKLAQTTLDNPSNEDLTRVTQLSEVWDTIGWIYFRQGDLANAEAFIQPAWILGQRQVVGDHLAEIYEKQGKMLQARELMDLAGQTTGRSTLTTEGAAFHAELLRNTIMLQGRKRVDAGELSKMRTVELPIHKKAQISAEFFVLLSSRGIEGAKFISGSDELRGDDKSLMQAKFDQPFAPGSKARLLRRGTLSCSEVGFCQFIMLLPRDAHAQ